MISVIIPSHNEGLVIGRTLNAMVSGARAGELDIIVVCNGCTDDTVEIARGFGPPVRVIETEMASKSHALNLGDQAASDFPRVYVDADVIITIDTIRALASRLNRGDVLAVAPRSRLDLKGCSWVVRAFYDIRSRLPSAEQGIGGSGVYALSKAGRMRFAGFPNITADDGFVRIQFKPEERETLTFVASSVFAPRTLKNLIAVRTRVYYGTLELAALFPDLWKNVGERNHRKLIGLLKYPPLWAKVLIYVFVNVTAQYKARARLRSRTIVWERDDTSRQSPTIAPGNHTGSST